MIFACSRQTWLAATTNRCPQTAVIDARGDRRNRAWFTKWHELGHRLILGDSSRDSSCRTHLADGVREPEETLVDRIAGACGFHPVLVRPFDTGILDPWSSDFSASVQADAEDETPTAAFMALKEFAPWMSSSWGEEP